jgi:hypothetical protein
MRLLILGLLLLTGMSCVTQKKCNAKFPPTTTTETIETVRDSIVYKDKLVPYYIPGETVHDSVPVPCPPPPPGFVPDTARAETEFARAKAWFSNSSIKLKLEQKATTLQLRLDSAVKEMYRWKTKYTNITTIPQPVKYIPQRFKTYRNIVFIIFALGFAFVGWKLYSFFKK